MKGRTLSFQNLIKLINLSAGLKKMSAGLKENVCRTKRIYFSNLKQWRISRTCVIYTGLYFKCHNM